MDKENKINYTWQVSKEYLNLEKKLCLWICEFEFQNKQTKMSKVAIVTGSNKGIGLATGWFSHGPKT